MAIPSYKTKQIRAKENDGKEKFNCFLMDLQNQGVKLQTMIDRNLDKLVQKAIYGPMIYTAPYVMALMQADPFRGQVEGDLAL